MLGRRVNRLRLLNLPHVVRQIMFIQDWLLEVHAPKQVFRFQRIFYFQCSLLRVITSIIFPLISFEQLGVIEQSLPVLSFFKKHVNFTILLLDRRDVLIDEVIIDLEFVVALFEFSTVLPQRSSRLLLRRQHHFRWDLRQQTFTDFWFNRGQHLLLLH